MKKLSIILILGLAISGCTKPGPVELQEDDAVLGVTSIVEADSIVVTASVDSTAMLPADQKRFRGLLQIAHVLYDFGQPPVEVAYSRVFFEDTTRPIVLPSAGRIIGYEGMDLGLLIGLNNGFMLRVGHRLLHRNGSRDTVAGVEYFRSLSGSGPVTYQPRTPYTWRSDSLGGLDVSIETPDDVVVISPRGGTIIPRDRDLDINWRGLGKMFIAISIYDGTRHLYKPIFKVGLRENRRHAVLASRILKLLPPERYVFTFVLENRKESEQVSGFNNQVLVQAASVYNSYVELR